MGGEEGEKKNFPFSSNRGGVGGGGGFKKVWVLDNHHGREVVRGSTPLRGERN